MDRMTLDSSYMTNEQWCKMWEAIKAIELDVRAFYVGEIEYTIETHRQVLTNIAEIQKQIQSVIGKME